MREKLRRILLSLPVVTVVSLFALYLVGGFFVLPAVVKWQLEKQVPRQLDHRISVGKVRFDPLAFRFEIDDLSLSDPQDRAMLGFKRLLLDFELRSLIDRAWTFEQAALEVPTLSFEIDRDGRHNFSAMLERLRAPEENNEQPSPLPRLLVRRIALTDGRVEFRDRLLEVPLVTRIEPLRIEIDELSSLPEKAAVFRVSARTAEGEVIESGGDLTLAPVAVKGRLALKDVRIATLAAGLSRFVTLDKPAGLLGFTTDFALNVDQDGVVSGGANGADLDIAGLSIGAAGGDAPLLALETLSLHQGRIDLGNRDATIERLHIAKGSVTASADAQGKLDWTKLARAPEAAEGSELPTASAQAPPTADARPPSQETPPAETPSTAPLPVDREPTAGAQEPWRLSVQDMDVSELAIAFSDAQAGRSANVAELTLQISPIVQAGASRTRVEAATAKMSITDARLANGTQRLRIPAASAGAGQLSFASEDRRIELAMETLSVSAPQGVSAGQGDDALELREASMSGSRISLTTQDSAIDGSLAGPKITLGSASMSGSGQQAQLLSLAFEGDRAVLHAGPQRFEAGIERPRATIAELRFTQGTDGADLRGFSIAGDQLTFAQAQTGARVVATAPVVSVSGLAARRGEERAALDQLDFESSQFTLSTGAVGSLDLALVRFRTTLTGLALDRGGEGIDLRSAALGGDSVSMTQTDGRLRIAGEAARASASGVIARRDADRLAVQEATFEAGAVSASTSAASNNGVSNSGASTSDASTGKASTDGASDGAAGVQVRLDDAKLELASVGVVTQGASSEIGSVSGAKLGAQSLVLALPQGPADVIGEGLAVALSGAVVRSPEDASELLKIQSAELSGGTFRLRDRAVTAEKLVLADGMTRTWLDAEGQFNWLRLFGGAMVGDGADKGAAPPDAQAATAAWRVAVRSTEFDGIAIGFEDRRESPALTLGLVAIRVRVAGLDNASPTPMRVELRAQVASGGEIEAEGDVRGDNGASELSLRLSEITLAPVQTYLSKFADLQLVSGTLSAEGRLRYGDEARAGAKLAYQGSVAVDRLRLEEIDPVRPFIAWDSVSSGDLAVALEPNRVDVGELRVDGLAGRLIIAEDQTVNLTDVLKRPRDGTKATGDGARSDATSTSAGDGETLDDRFPVAISRIRVSRGTLEFADLSLRPQFGARMHDLKGVITRLGTDADRSANLQLDALVDKYGSAKIRGQISVLRPEKLTEIDMAFRNLEMTSLSPYIVKFAGYRIAGGRLGLDLQYKVRDSKLLGENKIVLNQVELGEKVATPGALDLPLELAVAILKDSKGVIDIGLPVSGDLADPKFDYGAVIGKAIGNLLGAIVTAPFRALGAMFGPGEKQLDTIRFEPGSDTIPAPEREKLANVARALVERPALVLRVPPTYSAEADLPVLKSHAVRTEIAGRMGVALDPGEDPGPIDVADPRAQRAVAAVFSQRYAPEVLDALKRRAGGTPAPAREAGAPPAPVPANGPAQASPPAQAKPAEGDPPAAATAQPSVLPPEFYQDLVDRLIAEAPMSEEELAALATRRGDAILREVTTAGGVPAERVVLGETRKATDTAGNAVTLRLELEVAK